MQRNRQYLYGRFENGDYPDENDFQDLIDSFPLIEEIDQQLSTVLDGAAFKGVATVSTDPGVPTRDVFYFAQYTGAGKTFTNFSALEVAANELALLVYSVERGTWQKSTIGTIASGIIATEVTYGDLRSQLNQITPPNPELSIVGCQVYELEGSKMIPQPNIQMYYDISEDKWYIDLTGFPPIVLVIKYLQS